MWLSPKQVAIIPISDKFNDYAQKICEKLEENNIRVYLDLRSEKMGFKIRNAEINKIPIMAIIGEKEVSENKISIRKRFKGDIGMIDLDSFISDMNNEIKNKGV